MYLTEFFPFINGYLEIPNKFRPKKFHYFIYTTFLKMSKVEAKIMRTLITLDVVLTSIQRHLNVMDVETTFCAYWGGRLPVQLEFPAEYLESLSALSFQLDLSQTNRIFFFQRNDLHCHPDRSELIAFFV